MTSRLWSLLPAGLALPLVVAAVVAVLYLLRPPPRAVVVPSVLLWRLIAERHRSHTLLRRLVSAALSLAVALGISFALAGAPRSQRSGEHQLLVVDDSATMAAEAAPGLTRLARAAALASGLVADWPGPTLLADTTGRSAPRWARSTAEAEAWLRDLAASPTPGRLPAIERVPASATVPARRILVTDGVAIGSPAGWQVESVYTPATNVGLLAFAAGDRASPDRPEAFLEVLNASPAAVTARLVVERSSGEPLLDRRLDLGAHETWSGVLAFAPTPPGLDPALYARLETPGDALALDDRATGVARHAQRISVATVGVEGALERALRLLSGVTVAPLTGASWGGLEANAAGYDVLVAAGWAPETPPTVPALLVAPPPREWLPASDGSATATLWAWDAEGRDWGPLAVPELARYERLAEGARADSVAVLLEGAPERSGRNGAAPTEPLVFELRGTPAAVVVVAFPIESSSIAQHESFPLLVRSLVERLATPGGDLTAIVASAQPPFGRALTDINATTLPASSSRSEPGGGGQTDPVDPRGAAAPAPAPGAPSARRFALWMLAVAALIAILESAARARGLTE
jgi:hypothetical protein